MSARIYYVVQESPTTVWITYCIFHAADTKNDVAVWFSIGKRHENDMEGIRVTIQKDGSQYGTFSKLETLQHTEVEETTSPGWINGSHPAVYVEANGHGIHVANHHKYHQFVGDLYPQILPSDGTRALGLWVAGRGAEIPSSTNDRDVSIELVPFEGTIWTHRNDGDTFVDVAITPGTTSIGGSFAGHDGCNANPPWSWPEPSASGVNWFFNPNGSSPFDSSQYTYNPLATDPQGTLTDFPSFCSQ